MENVTFNKRSVFLRLFGKPITKELKNNSLWNYSDDKLTIEYAKIPELQEKGGAIRLEAGDELPCRVLVIHGDDGLPHAFVNVCAHAKRRLDPVPGTMTVQCCSMGRSTYTYDGDKVFGDAPHGITPLDVAQENGQVVISGFNK